MPNGALLRRVTTRLVISRHGQIHARALGRSHIGPVASFSLTAERRSKGQFTVVGEEEKLGQSFIASALAIVASAIIGAVSLGGIRAQQSLEPVSVIVFPGGFNWPIWIAQDKGYFASGGIEVNLTNTPNSVFQLTNLIEGKFDIAMTAIDNVIAYMEGQGEAPTQVKPDLTVFMGGDNGFLSLVTVPEVRNVTSRI